MRGRSVGAKLQPGAQLACPGALGVPTSFLALLRSLPVALYCRRAPNPRDLKCAKIPLLLKNWNGGVSPIVTRPMPHAL